MSASASVTPVATFRALALFNDALGGSFRAGVVPESDARRAQAEGRRDLDHIPMLNGYRSGDPLVPTSLGYLPVEAATPEGAAEQLFYLLNRDERPNGRNERSLSVGDIALVESTSGERYFFAVERFGFRELTGEEANSVKRQV